MEKNQKCSVAVIL